MMGLIINVNTLHSMSVVPRNRVIICMIEVVKFFIQFILQDRGEFQL